ncbi:single-stranded-DNA-specific exonuclease RecJ [Heliobacillus mobilis]|uniref:Single-stranded-DNA-specific exonuclease RecJ n=1 Tax=Heliobacterium mobile TaxID=28064 RepID=A0A6I3SCR3_HELMO|nr:single-stranded-DNA-specific exonuclease RecJ [Heliobacterium mobile]MTV47899.1 single-stranded-DNA-specific exonuclease RecJ [Heliobacterium mobile]
MRWVFPKQQSMPPYPGLSPFQSALLWRRGIKPDDAEAFIRSSIDDMHDSLLLKDAGKAAQLIRQAIDNQTPVTVYGDYDCDGVTGTALMVESLRKLGAQVDWYINSRFVDGFGMHPNGVEEIARRGGHPRLIVSVDNGISAVTAVQRAKELGMQVVVTDHHEPGSELPPADAIVNPRQADCPYPYKSLAGVGVAFKVLQILFNEAGCPRELLRSLDLVAIGTVADVMPVTGENRIFVKNGLKLINWGERARTGLRAIKEVAALHREVNAHYHLGFIFGPMLNATGRLDGVPATAVDLLLTRDYAQARALAMELKDVNQQRQEMTRRQTDKATRLVNQRDSFLVVYDPEFHEGIVGLIASRLKEEYYRPVLVLTDSEDAGILKGSVRSVKGFSVKEHLIDDCADLLTKGGGHEMAAGCSLPRENLPLLRERLNRAAGSVSPELFTPLLEIDYLLRPEDLDMVLIEEIEQFAPYGVGCPRPNILLAPFWPEQVRFMGREGNHLRLSGGGVQVIGFNQAEEYRQAGIDGPLAILGLPEINDYDGAIQFRMRDDGWQAYGDVFAANQ